MHCRRIGWTTVRPPKDSNLFSLYQKRRHSGACKPFQVRLTAFSHRRPRHRPRTRSGRVPTVKGALGIQGRHWFDTSASHSAPSTRQDGARNVNKQRKTHHERKQTSSVGNVGALRRRRPRQPGIRPRIHLQTRHAGGSIQRRSDRRHPGRQHGRGHRVVARIACQAIDKALKRHIERGGYSDTPEMLTGLHIDPMGDIRDGRP